MMKKLRVFIASPSDTDEERDCASLVVRDMNIHSGDLLGVELEVIRWETHAWPDIGDEHAQDVINKQIGEYDVLVGMMWRRCGTPTNRASSGTVEEFERAYEYFRMYQRPKVMFYFRIEPFYLENLKEISQFRKVIQFKNKLKKLGVLFWEYKETIDFERLVRNHLTNQIKIIRSEEEQSVAANTSGALLS